MRNLRNTAEFKNLRDVILDIVGSSDVVYLKNTGNWGDRLIHEGGMQFMNSLDIPYSMISRADFDKKIRTSDEYRASMSEAVAVYCGSGAWSTFWSGTRRGLEKFGKLFRHNIVLPTTFELPPANVPNVTYFARDKLQSMQHIPESIFCHDMAFYFDSDVPLREPEVNRGYFYRDDKERSEDASFNPHSIDISALGTHDSKIDPLFKLLSNFKVIETDRLHVCVAAALMERNCELRPGAYFKAEAIFDSSIKNNYDTVKLIKWE